MKRRHRQMHRLIWFCLVPLLVFLLLMRPQAAHFIYIFEPFDPAIGYFEGTGE